MSETILNNASFFRYENSKIALFDDNEVKLGIVDDNDQTWNKLKKIKQKIDYTFVLNENGKIYIVFNDGGVQMFPVLSVDYDDNCLVSKYEYQNVWFPPSAHSHYQRMLKLKSVMDNETINPNC